MPREYVLLSVVILFCLAGCGLDYETTESGLSTAERKALPLVPLPASIVLTDEKVNLNNGVYVVPALAHSPLIAHSLERFITQMKASGISTSNPQGLEVGITVHNQADIGPSIELDESYQLSIEPNTITISADNYIGLNHGLQTLGQLLHDSKETGTLSVMEIQDTPRFNWRGIMIDVSRHWIPIELLEEQLDAMAIAKMNVLHLHLSDDQAFRMESKVFPLLHTEGSGGHYYTQKEMSRLVVRAKERGIRIVPEFDIPGHTTSWLAGYPELAARQGTYTIQENYGVFPAILNPVSDVTFAFIHDLFSEMSRIFPDEYIHIGGDAILFDDWVDNEEVSAFMADNNLNDPRQVQAYFYLRVQQLIQQIGKKMIGWDEVLRPELEKAGTLIQVRHGQRTLIQAIEMGISAIYSSGWNLDHNLPMSEMYAVDPVPDIAHQEVAVDSSRWEAWRLHIEINNLPSEGSLVLYGPDHRMTGVINIMDQSVVLSSARRTNNQLDINFTGGFGSASINGTTEADQFKGALDLAVSDVQVSGEQIGGHDFENGIAFPIYNPPSALSPEVKNRIIGGEACLWTEWVDQSNILSRLWPRSLAIAEKLWSPAQHTQYDKDFYDRASKSAQYLLTQNIDYEGTINSFALSVASQYATYDLLSFLQSLEVVKYFERWSYQIDHTASDSLNKIADIVIPESMVAHQFGQLVFEIQQEGVSPETKMGIMRQLESWIPLYRSIRPAFENERLKSVEVLALSLSDLSKIALHVMESGTLTPKESEYYERLKLNAQRKIDGVYLAPAAHLITLIDRFRMEL